MKRGVSPSVSPRLLLAALLACKWVEAASADPGSYVVPPYGVHAVGYPVSGAVTSGAVYGRRLLAEPGIPIGIAGIGPYLPPNVHVPPGGLGGFGRKLTSYHGRTSGIVTYTSGAVSAGAYRGRRLLSYGYPASGAITSGAVPSGAVPAYGYSGRRLLAYGTPYAGAVTLTSGAVKPYGFRRLHALYETAVTTTSGAVTMTSGAVGHYGRKLQQSSYTFPTSGAVTAPSGAVTVPSGAVTIPSGAITVPSGAVTVPSGAVQVPSGAVLLPPHAALPPGTIIIPVYGPPPLLYAPSYVGRRLSVLPDPPLTAARCYPSLLNTVTSEPAIADFLILFSRFGLSSYLDQTGTTMTLFAPTNAALTAAGLDVRSTSSAETLLMNHIVPDLQLPSQLTAPVSADSLAGFVLTIVPAGAGGVQVSSGSSTAMSIGSEETSCRGTAYVIDHVLVPPRAAA